MEYKTKLSTDHPKIPPTLCSEQHPFLIDFQCLHSLLNQQLPMQSVSVRILTFSLKSEE
uniref:Ribulose-1 5 bisphosphate carboxylase/oxygenase large subunit N-methyltransferase n=1 Tax=Rhizophora mucronata TaxID=61149 RepID=A0A2P2LEW2_RHIMU